MKLQLYTFISKTEYVNPRLLTIVLFCFLTGITTGVFNEIQLSADARESMEDFLNSSVLSAGFNGEGLPALFLKSAAANGGLFLIILLAGVTIIGFPAALLVLAYKGAALGFASTLLIDTLSAKGILLVALKLLPPNIFLIPALCGASAASFKFGLSILSGGRRNIKKNLTGRSGHYLIFQAFMGVLILAGCLVESLISLL